MNEATLGAAAAETKMQSQHHLPLGDGSRATVSERTGTPPDPAEGFCKDGELALRAQRITLNARQLHQAWELANPDPGDQDQEETEVTIRWWPGGKNTDGEDAPEGFYACLTEYPEEGALFLDPEQRIDAPQTEAKSLQPLLDALHRDIMNLPPERLAGFSVQQRTWYAIGHRDARHAAAELVAAFASSGSNGNEVGPAPLPVQGQEAARYQFLRSHAAIRILYEVFGKEAGRNPDDELDAAVDYSIDAALRASSAPTTKG